MEIYTDGSCKVHTTGLGCWAYVVVENGKNIFEDWNNEINTTNNAMELTALEKALVYAISQPNKQIKIISDSQYCVNGYNNWVFGWERSDWKKDSGGVKNLELWQSIHELRADNILVEWVKGHNGNKWNEYCDKLTQKVDKLVEANTRIVRKVKKEEPPMYPIFFEGKYWDREDCYDIFVASYKKASDLDENTSVYVSENDRIQPNGYWVF